MEDEDIYDFLEESDPKVCVLSSSCNQADLELLKKVSSGSRYFCRQCQRSANDATMLCSPVSL